jgi:hypothetical protein
MAPGYRHDDARANGGAYGPPRGADSDATPYRSARLPEGGGPRDRDARPFPPPPPGAPTATYDDGKYDRGYPDRRDPGHRDSRHEASYYNDDRYRDSHYDERDDRYGRDQRAYRGREESHDRDGGRGEYEGRDGYRNGMDGNQESYDEDGPGSGQETRRVSPEELNLPELKRRGRPAPGRADEFDDRTTVDVPKQRREPRPSSPDAESTMFLPKQSGPDERTEMFTPRSGAGAGATRPMGRPDDASTQIIRNPEDLPRIDIPGASDDQATQLFQRPDDLRPVFVDEGGKRGKRLKILVRVIGVLLLLFLAGMIFALTGGGDNNKVGTVEQKDSTPAPDKTSASAKPKASASARVGVQPSAAQNNSAPTAKAPLPTPKKTEPAPTPTRDETQGNGNGGLPTVIPTLVPTTASPAGDPTATATADAGNGNGNGRGNRGNG